VTRADPKDGDVASQQWQKAGGIGQSGLGGRSGGDANIEESTERRWLTVNSAPAPYPY
jgi:acyl-CoA reductase-like NAD-dependent aldehyde dehydrogenase